ncbi:MAG: hypothetical protein E7280_04510 [Lachnospiraceae bacterium]|nr:hypothetical protein [Lachnospiraceae bacterium]
MDENVVLCVSNAYEKKFYLDEAFQGLPQRIKDELKIMCVLFTEDVGGILKLVFDEEGCLQIETECAEEDLLYDEIGSGLLVKKMQRDKAELFASLEMFFKVFYLGQDEED